MDLTLNCLTSKGYLNDREINLNKITTLCGINLISALPYR